MPFGKKGPVKKVTKKGPVRKFKTKFDVMNEINRIKKSSLPLEKKRALISKLLKLI